MSIYCKQEITSSCAPIMRAEREEDMKTGVALDHLNFTVKSLEASEEFYRYFFGFEVVESGMDSGVPWKILRSGDSMLCMSEYPKKEYSDSREELRMNHFAFRIPDAGEFAQKIQSKGIETYYGSPLQYPNSTSWYIKDPSGYMIEVAHWNNNEVRFN